MRRRKVRRVAVRLARGRGGREPLPGARAAEKLARQERKEQGRGLVEGLVLVGDMYSGRQVEEALVLVEDPLPGGHYPAMFEWLVA